MGFGRRSEFGESGHGRRLIVALATMLALLWQSLVLQTHVHPASAPATHHVVRAGAASDRAPADDRAACPLCRQIARAGAYVSPGDAAIDTPVVAPFIAIAAAFLLWPGRHAAHGWYGRGPPVRAAR